MIFLLNRYKLCLVTPFPFLVLSAPLTMCCVGTGDERVCGPDALWCLRGRDPAGSAAGFLPGLGLKPAGWGVAACSGSLAGGPAQRPPGLEEGLFSVQRALFSTWPSSCHIRLVTSVRGLGGYAEGRGPSLTMSLREVSQQAHQPLLSLARGLSCGHI